MPRKPDENSFDDFNKGDLVEVLWIDALVATGWTETAELKKKKPDIQCRTSGYFLFATDEYVCLCSSSGQKNFKEVNGVMYIPLDWTQEVRRLPSA